MYTVSSLGDDPCVDALLVKSASWIHVLPACLRRMHWRCTGLVCQEHLLLQSIGHVLGCWFRSSFVFFSIGLCILA